MATAASPPARPSPARKGIVLPRVEVFASGVWQGDVYTIRDLDDMVRNFHALYPQVEPPVKIGHDDLQEFSGVPAVGWVVDLYREGPKLFADLEQIFPDIADLIDAGAYKKVSAEIYPRGEPPEGVKATGYVFKAVAFLGGELPHLKHLSELPAPVRFAEKVRRRRLHLPPVLSMMRGGAGRKHRVFFEATPMDRKALEEQLKGVGWTDEMIAALSGLSDDDFGKFVLLALAQEAAEDAPAPAPGQADATWPQGMDRNAVVAELVAMGEDQAAVEAMSDADLLALYEQRKTAMSDTTTTPAPTPAAGAAPKQVTYKFAELESKAGELEKRMAAAEEREKAAERVRRLREANERKSLVHAFCERMVKEGRLSPAQVEVTKDGKTVGPVRLRLERAGAVRKFADKPSELELQMAEIEAQQPVRRYGELIADPLAVDRLSSLEQRTKAWAARRNGKQTA
jgi:hypothetical protein